jgi:hypothetical protein
MTACLRPSDTQAWLTVRPDAYGKLEVCGHCTWTQVMRDQTFDRGATTRFGSQRDARRWCKRHNITPTADEAAAIAGLYPK